MRSICTASGRVCRPEILQPLNCRWYPNASRSAGTPDAIGQVNGQLCLVDWKTSNGVYVDYLLQLAAYRRLWEKNNLSSRWSAGSTCRFREHGDFAHHYYSELDKGVEMFRNTYALHTNGRRRAKKRA